MAEKIEWCFSSGIPTAGVHKCVRKAKVGCPKCPSIGEKSREYYEKHLMGKDI